MLLLLVILVLPFSLGNEHSRPALQEDFNVLVYGTLQLSEALTDTYSSTTGKLQRVVGRQAKQEQTMERLKAEVARARQARRRLGVESETLQREEQEGRSLVQRMEQDLREIQTRYGDLGNRVQEMEQRAQVKEWTIPDIKDKVERQSIILQVLTQEAERQKEQMAKQREQLLQLLKKYNLTCVLVNEAEMAADMKHSRGLQPLVRR
ncbi:angiopoietin-like protein 8 [Mantella aurantiaca]